MTVESWRVFPFGLFTCSGRATGAEDRACAHVWLLFSARWLMAPPPPPTIPILCSLCHCHRSGYDAAGTYIGIGGGAYWVAPTLDLRARNITSIAPGGLSCWTFGPTSYTYVNDALGILLDNNPLTSVPNGSLFTSAAAVRYDRPSVLSLHIVCPECTFLVHV